MRTHDEELEQRQAANQHAFINQLPNEVFIDICCVVLDSFGAESERTWFGRQDILSCDEWERQVVGFLASVSAVCSIWRHATLSAPVLWRKISLARLSLRSSSVVRERLMTFLARSKTTTLDLYITLGSRNTSSEARAPFELWESMARILLASIERCRTFHLMHNWNRTTTPLLPLQGSLRNLQNFEFEVQMGPGIYQSQVLLGPENLSPLRQLKIVLPWSAVYPVLRNMRTENITSLFFNSIGTDWEEMVNFISKCSGVTQIVIFTAHPPPPSLECSPTTYSHLTSLSIKDTMPPTFPRYMSTPALQELSISACTVDGPTYRTPTSFPFLTRITLGYFNFSTIPSSTLYHFLREQPSLSTIVLSRCGNIAIFLRFLSDVDYACRSLGVASLRNEWAKECLPNLQLLSLQSARQPQRFRYGHGVVSRPAVNELELLLASLLDQRPLLCVEYDQGTFRRSPDSVKVLKLRGSRFVELPGPRRSTTTQDGAVTYPHRGKWARALLVSTLSLGAITHTVV